MVHAADVGDAEDTVARAAKAHRADVGTDRKRVTPRTPWRSGVSRVSPSVRECVRGPGAIGHSAPCVRASPRTVWCARGAPPVAQPLHAVARGLWF